MTHNLRVYRYNKNIWYKIEEKKWVLSKFYN